MRNQESGFSLMEVIVVLAILAILAAMAYPAFNTWRENAQYREAARNIASILRDARSTAITRSNLHRVVIEPANRHYYIQAAVDGVYDNTTPVKIRENTLNNVVTLRTGNGCDQQGDVRIEFLPDGSSRAINAAGVPLIPQLPPRICVRDNSSNRFFVQITAVATGRVEVTRP